MSAREAILQRLRRHGAGDPAAIEAWAAAGPVGPRPRQGALDGDARIEQFIEKARVADATVTRIAGVEALPAAMAAELRARNLPAALRTGSDAMFRALDWGALDRSEGVGRVEEPATLSRAEFGLAETGTLALASGPDNPVTLTFLGETHFVALKTADVQAGFEDFWAAWRERGLKPRTLNMVTGPSRSADIGQTLQLGAHGPVALHIFLID